MEFQQVIKSRMAEWCQAMTNNNATSRAIVLCQQNVEISSFFYNLIAEYKTSMKKCCRIYFL